MDSHFVLEPDSVAIIDAEDKGAILAALSSMFARKWDLDEAVILEYLEERENLGSTGFGRGIAIPHARIPEIQRPVAALVRLRHAADFNAADGLPVDLVFGLLSPENSGAGHLHALAAISRLVRDDTIRDALADAPDEEAMYALLTNLSDQNVA